MGMDFIVGEIRLFAFAWAPVGWARCDGTLLSVEQYPLLYAALGSQYGGDGTHTFALPDLRGHTPVHNGMGPEGFSVEPGEAGGQYHVVLTAEQIPPHTHPVHGYQSHPHRAVDGNVSAGAWQIPTSGAGQGTFQMGVADAAAHTETGTAADIAAPQRLLWAQDTVSSAGEGAAHSNMQPSLVINACVAIETSPQQTQSQHYQGEIRLFATDALPDGWLPCDGRQLSVETHETLYSLLGNWFGGDGVHEFALPDLRGRIPVHAGKGSANMPPLRVGTPLGAETVALTIDQMPVHRHQLLDPSGAPTSSSVAGSPGVGLPGNEGGLAPVSQVAEGEASQVSALHAETLGQSGLSEAHDNMMRSITWQYAIAIEGEYPPEP